MWIYHSYMRLGDDHNAVIGRTRTLTAYSNEPMQIFTDIANPFFQALKKSGRRGIVQVWLEDVAQGRAREVHRYNRALWLVWIGEYDAALTELEAGVKSRPYQMIYAAADPAFANLRSNPRFQQVIRSLDLAR